MTRVLACACLVAATLGAACGPNPPTPSPSPSPVLAITLIFPSSGPPAGSTLVKIYGHGFEPGSIVQIDSTVVPAVVRNPDVIDVTMPAHSAGFVDITVTTPAGVAATRPRAFNYLNVDPPMVIDVTPPTGALEGQNLVKIRGTGFDLSAVVTIDGVRAYDYGAPRTSTLLQLYAPAHAAGSVELAVTNLDGRTHRLPGGYTYAPAETFDLNGIWRGFLWDTEVIMSVTIQNDFVMGFTCGALNHTFSPPAVVAHGRFSINAPGISMAGQALSPIEAGGSLTAPGCSGPFGWSAFK